MIYVVYCTYIYIYVPIITSITHNIYYKYILCSMIYIYTYYIIYHLTVLLWSRLSFRTTHMDGNICSKALQ